MNVLLIDDEPQALDLLERQIVKLEQNVTVHKFTSFVVNDHLDLLSEIDAAFLDIEMPHVNGLELAAQISDINPHLPIVFVTAFNEYAIQAFELYALDYLLKPVLTERLQTTLDRIPVKTKKISKEDFLQLKVSHAFEVKNDDGTYAPLKWRTTKTQELFLFLLHHKGEAIQKDFIIDLLWEDAALEKAYAQLYTTIYYIRRNIAAFDPYLKIKNEQSGYVLAAENITIDLEEWERQLLDAPPINGETIQQHEDIMAIYVDGYLASYTYDWAEKERFRLEKLWVRHAKLMADFYHVHDRLENAIEWYTKVVDIHPEDEQANFMIMKIYADLDYGLLVNHQYTFLCKALEELDVSVSSSIRKWFEKWERQRAGNSSV